MFYYFLEKNAFSSIRKCNFFQRFCIAISKIKFIFLYPITFMLLQIIWDGNKCIYSFIEFINFKNYFTIS